MTPNPQRLFNGLGSTADEEDPKRGLALIIRWSRPAGTPAGNLDLADLGSCISIIGQSVCLVSLVGLVPLAPCWRRAGALTMVAH